jgi:hypothetical protein
LVQFGWGMKRISTASAALAASVLLAACATSPPADPAPAAAAAPATGATPVAVGGQQRDLTPDEKKVIVEAVAPSLRNAGSAKYRWTKFPVVPESDTVAYCATVDAQSPHAAYDGRQAYIVDAKVVGGHITAAAMGLIAGGKDASIVGGMCAEHGLNPNNAS